MGMGRLILLIMAGLGLAVADAQVPQTLNYQGLLTDASGSPVADGSYSLTFRIYDAASGGTQLWTETEPNVAVSGGLFKATLGNVTPLTVGFDDAYWLEVQVGAESPQVPRIELTSSPYAFMATDIVPDVVSSIDGVSNDGGDIDLVAGANVTITPDDGANTITIAASGGGGDITGVSAGQGLTGGGTSGDVYLDVGAGTGIAVSADAVGLTSAYANGSAHDGRFVNEGQNNSVTSAMIVDGTIQPGDMGFSAGDVTAVWTGDGLWGGGDQGDLTLSVANPLELTGSSTYGVIRGTHTDGNRGYLGNAGCGVLGSGAGGNYGQLGCESLWGASGMHVTGNWGALGAADYGVQGVCANGNWGALGASGYGTTGNGASGYWGGLGGSSFAGYFHGDVVVVGTVSKLGGSFVIDHPLDPENRLLRHNFVESPENLLIYRGKVHLDSGGEALVEMPAYFEALTKEDEGSIHLTAVGKPFLTGADWNPGFRRFTVYGEPGREVFWEVLAERDDPVIRQLARPVEEEKGPDNKYCDRGKLLHPAAYGYPETMGRDYERIMQIEQEMAAVRAAREAQEVPGTRAPDGGDQGSRSPGLPAR